MEWSENSVARLRKLWDEGHSTASIGLQVGMTKNAVVGKAHRIGLPGRGSPIIRVGEPKYRAPPPKVVGSAPSLAPLASLMGVKPIVIKLAPPRKPAPPVRVAAPAAPVLAADGPPCCFPVGSHVRQPGFFCGDPSRRGRPYCPHHCAIAYRPFEARRDAA